MIYAGTTLRADQVAHHVGYWESDENYSTADAEPAVLVSAQVLFVPGVVYRLYGRSRCRPMSSDDYGKLFAVRIRVDGVTVEEARSVTATGSTGTGATNFAMPEHPAFTVDEPRYVLLTLEAARTSTPSWTGNAEFRGSGGVQFTHRLAVSALPHRAY